MPRTLARHLAGQDLKTVILDRADDLLARYGYARFTMDDLARAVGVGKGTLYLHFESKEDVALSVIKRVVYGVYEQLSRVAARDEDPAARLRAMLVVRVLGRYDGFAHYTATLNELLATLRPALQQLRDRHRDEEARIFAAVIEEGMGAGTFARGDPLAAARLIMLATESLLPSNLTPRELGRRASVAARADALAALLVGGLTVVAAP